jgi:hypothetical protein
MRFAMADTAPVKCLYHLYPFQVPPFQSARIRKLKFEFSHLGC